jgi:16S rRNA (guanine1207-N2)-methyltransferase
MSLRLSLALDMGASVPSEGRILLMHPKPEEDFSYLPRERVLVVHPFRPDHDAFAARGFACVASLADLEAPEQFALAAVFVTRAKPLARALVAQAAAACSGPVYVDGGKTDGIDSMLKALRGLAEVSAPLSKAHGKIFSLPGGSALPQDWSGAPAALPGGYTTAPGVFSADGVDPASALLVSALPPKLGRRIGDLGAGWGYLSAHLNERPEVESLHLVEADAAALACARLNVPGGKAQFYWADARDWKAPEPLDAVVMNPPFHTSRAAEPALGQAFIASAARQLTASGQLWLVANRHLPYEQALAERFAAVQEVAGDNRFKVLQAQRPKRQRK